MSTVYPETPDVEALVYQLLVDLGGIQSWAYDASTPWPHVTDVVSMQVDVYAASKKVARDRAYMARQRMLALPLEDTNVSLVEVISGPFWMESPDGAPRYIIRIAVTVRGYRGLLERKQNAS
jgi:hypothetical protein